MAKSAVEEYEALFRDLINKTLVILVHVGLVIEWLTLQLILLAP